jgi:hypothetical protein
MNNRPVQRDGNPEKRFSNSAGVEPVHSYLGYTFNSFGVGKSFLALSVGFTYGYSHSSPSDL